MDEFKPFGKIGRLSRDCIVTEKIDGTNSLIAIGDDGETFQVGSRNRWIVPGDDNFGFAAWAHAHKDELLTLGPGFHYGEWWGGKIGRGYGLKEKRFSLFNTHAWADDAMRPPCCHVVPVLYAGPFSTTGIELALHTLSVTGSQAAPGFMRPEGIIVYHTANGVYFKKTIENDGKGKSEC